MDPNDQSLVALAEKVIAILDQGSFTQTYKYATLSALLDLTSSTPSTLTDPVVLYMPMLAERVIELYLPQTQPFADEERAFDLLSQGSNTGKSIVALIREFRVKHNIIGYPTSRMLSQRYPSEFASLRVAVEYTLARYPVLLLQNIGQSNSPFLYSVNWNDRITLAQVRRQEYDNRIILLPGAASALLRIAGLLRPLIQMHWAHKIAKLNSIKEGRLGDFLFGVDRASLLPLTQPLIDMQGGFCFYCSEKFSKVDNLKPEVDHFIPWSRYQNNCLVNLVAAHRRCNNSKRAHFASIGHLRLWCVRDEESLRAIATDKDWEFDLERTRSITKILYEALPDSTPLWCSGDEFQEMDCRELPWFSTSDRS